MATNAIGGDDSITSQSASSVGDPVEMKKAHSARMYDYYLGGKDNFQCDRTAAEQVERAFPTIKLCARVNRAFMHRATRYLAAEHGIRQFLDIGTGIPTQPNLHQVAQAVAPEARVVYADFDPLVLTHARALMAGTPEGETAYIQADVTDPNSILTAPELASTLDLTKPVALSLIALLHFVQDDEHDAYGIVSTLLDALAPGSFLVMTHLSPDFNPVQVAGIVDAYRGNGLSLQARTNAEFARFFNGLDVIEPGITGSHRWRPDPEPPVAVGAETPEDMDAKVSFWAAVGRK
ncbi:SAM-dependent methyltransferase [Nocardia miyunensis]|uniref:SAM-dependent methyltransferase n=1 Tax=Nocardia miyunensis TaxID=282684 RepID=UPI000A032BB8|nr:SAM-dependent methyltransferase [Nocardia miyunensis]